MTRRKKSTVTQQLAIKVEEKNSITFIINFLGMLDRTGRPWIAKTYIYNISPNTFNNDTVYYENIIKYLLKNSIIESRISSINEETEYHLTPYGSEIIRKAFIHSND